ncbi:unnamed protein product [Coregonus sp. 'balchen']|nr:unnamed protein product [Coregonus sp. 'balchen']
MEDTIDTAMGVFSDQYLSSNDSLLFNITPTHFPSLSPIIDQTISITTIVILFITMVSLGCTMEVSKIKAHILKPKGIAIAVVAQFGVMPLTAFLLAKVLQLGPVEAVVVLICGCCPGGSLSNILALALKGDMNLSWHLLGPGHDFFPPQHGKTQSIYGPAVGLSILLMSMVVIGLLVSMTVGGMDLMLTVLSPPLIATAALMPLIGYTFGYVLSYLFKLNGSGRRTIAMETGCQNIQLCSTILKVAFPPDVIGPLYLFPMIYIVCQVGEAFLLIALFRVHQRFFKTPKKEQQVFEAMDKQPEEMKLSDVAV